MATHVRLNSAQKYKVQQWVDSWREIIKNEGWTIPRLTAEVRTKVDFEITENIIAKVCEDFGIESTSPRPDVVERSRITKELTTRINTLEKQAESFRDCILDTRTVLEKKFDEANLLLDAMSKDNAELRKENAELRKEQSVLRERMSRLDVEFNDLLKHLGLKRLDSIVGKIVSGVKPV